MVYYRWFIADGLLHLPECIAATTVLTFHPWLKDHHNFHIAYFCNAVLPFMIHFYHRNTWTIPNLRSFWNVASLGSKVNNIPFFTSDKLLHFCVTTTIGMSSKRQVYTLYSVQIYWWHVTSASGYLVLIWKIGESHIDMINYFISNNTCFDYV